MTNSEIKKICEANGLLNKYDFDVTFATRFYITHNQKLNKDILIRHWLKSDIAEGYNNPPAKRRSQKYLIEAILLSDDDNAKQKVDRIGKVEYDLYFNSTAGHKPSGILNKYQVEREHKGINFQGKGIGYTLFKLMENHMIERDSFYFYLNVLPDINSFEFSFAEFMEGRITATDQLKHIYEKLGMRQDQYNPFVMQKNLTANDLHSLESLKLEPIDFEAILIETQPTQPISDAIPVI